MAHTTRKVVWSTLGVIFAPVIALVLLLGYLIASLPGVYQSTCSPDVAQAAKSIALGTGPDADAYFDQFAPGDRADREKNALLIVSIGRSKGLSDNTIAIAVETAIQESQLQNLNHGDLDSLGLFQQQWSQGWGTPAQIMDPVYSTNKFYDELVKIADRDSPSRQRVDVAIEVQHPNPLGYHLMWKWDKIGTQIVARSSKGPSALATPLPSAGLPVCEQGPSLNTGKRSLLPGDSAAVAGSAIRGDDYPWASWPTLVSTPIGYYARECVDFASWRLNEQYGLIHGTWKFDNRTGIVNGSWRFNNLGNADTWRERLVDEGYKADTTPGVGAVLWFAPHGGDPRYVLAGKLGHVAIVSAINLVKGTVIIEQYNGMAPPNDHLYSKIEVPVNMPGTLYIHVADTNK